MRTATFDSRVHDAASFDCGNEELNLWCRQAAGQSNRKLLANTSVLLDGDRVIGFYTLAIRGLISRTLLPASLSKRLPLTVPAISLARLAVSKGRQGDGLGAVLLCDAMTRAKAVARQIGGVFLLVDAKDLVVANFYRKYGFVPLPDNPLQLCLPIGSIPD